MLELIKAWDKGYSDFCNNITQCPYSDKNLIKEWNKGWKAAKYNEQSLLPNKP